MCKTTRRDMYRAAALTGLLANLRNVDDKKKATVYLACEIGDIMETRAKVEDAERYAEKSDRRPHLIHDCGEESDSGKD